MKKKVILDIKGMHCASCSTLINRSLNKVDGVESANVNLSMNKAIVDFDDSKVKTDDLIEVVKKKGYGAKEIDQIDTDVEARRRTTMVLAHSMMCPCLTIHRVF